MPYWLKNWRDLPRGPVRQEADSRIVPPSSGGIGIRLKKPSTMS